MSVKINPNKFEIKIAHVNIKLLSILILAIIVVSTINGVKAQVDSGVKLITTFHPDPIYNANNPETYADRYYGSSPVFIGDSNGDGRFFVFESNANIATYNPRNSDRNWEIFLMDIAQRHIFQITNTKNGVADINVPPSDPHNVRALIINKRPVISNNGKWIAFASNATTSTPQVPDNTNPGNFDANTPGAITILQQDGNTEIWLYQIPNYTAVDLSTGDTPAFVDLAGGSFTRVTNTPPYYPPVYYPQAPYPIIRLDNDYVAIDDTGSTLAFVSSRDLVSNGNYCAPPAAACDNQEIFVYKRLLNRISQVTQTPRGDILHDIHNGAPSLSGDGSRIVFESNASNAIIGMVGSSNPDFSEEIYLADLNSVGEPYQGGLKLQVTESTINTYDLYTYFHLRSRSISRDGRYVLLQSIARLDSDPGSSASAPAVFLFDCSTNCLAGTANFRQIGPRFDADSAVAYPADGGGLLHPEFTDYNANLAPGGVIFHSRMNFRADGVVPTTASEGLNPVSPRPQQIFYYSLTAQTNPFTRLTTSQNIEWGVRTRVLATNKRERIHFVSLKEYWSGVSLFQLLTPSVTQEDTNSGFVYFTGASGMSISGTPPQAPGLMPNMLGSAVYLSQLTPSTAVGYASQVLNSRNFVSPLQLKGVSLTIDGISANITGVSNGQINFIVPAGLTAGNKPFVMNNNGIIIRGTVPIIQTPQPDIVRSANIPSVKLTFSEISPAPHGRARILDVTDPINPKAEPFTVTTQTANGTVPTKLRLFLTGVEGVTADAITIKLGTVTIPTASITTNAVKSDYPGIYTFDFEVPPQLNGAGHVSVFVSVLNGGQSRPVETAPRTRFISTQAITTDLAVWRPNNGTWYILDNNGANQIYVQWGTSTDYPAPGDYDGDGKTDFCVFRPAEGNWYLYASSNNTVYVYHFGQNGDEIAQADYDGDRKTDLAVFRPADGYWYILQSSNNQFVAKSLGTTGDKLVPADYDGDGKADVAVWKNAEARFVVKGTIENSLAQINFGQTGDKPVIGDYDGDGRADLATWRSSDNTWRILNSNSGQLTSVQWGNAATDIAVQGDYDADGRTDIAVWRSSGSLAGWWTIFQSGNGQTRAEQWGTSGDIPVPAPW